MKTERLRGKKHFSQNLLETLRTFFLFKKNLFQAYLIFTFQDNGSFFKFVSIKALYCQYNKSCH